MTEDEYIRQLEKDNDRLEDVLKIQELSYKSLMETHAKALQQLVEVSQVNRQLADRIMDLEEGYIGFVSDLYERDTANG